MKRSLPLLLVTALFAAAAWAGGGYFYFDGKDRIDVTLDDTLVAEFPGNSPAGVTGLKGTAPGAELKHSSGGARVWKMTQGVSGLAVVQTAGNVSPVFRDGSSGRMMALPGGVIVNFDPSWSAAKVNNWASGKNLTVERKLEIGGNYYVISSPPGIPSLDLANSIHQGGEVVSATPDWWHETSKR